MANRMDKGIIVFGFGSGYRLLQSGVNQAREQETNSHRYNDRNAEVEPDIAELRLHLQKIITPDDLFSTDVFYCYSVSSKRTFSSSIGPTGLGSTP